MPTDHPHGYLSDAALAAYNAASTASITYQLLRRGFRNQYLTELVAVRPERKMVGYAFTLRFVPMREDLTLGEIDNRTSAQRQAVENVGPQDVLVMDARGELGAGTLGNILTERMVIRGAVGLVTDGAMRDTSEFRNIDIATYVRGTHQAPSMARHYPADFNTPIGCAGVLVMPGDVLVGDADGVVVVPANIAEEVAFAAAEQEAREAFVLDKIRAGAEIYGVYPPGPDLIAEYEARKREDSGD